MTKDFGWLIKTYILKAPRIAVPRHSYAVQIPLDGCDATTVAFKRLGQRSPLFYRSPSSAPSSSRHPTTRGRGALHSLVSDSHKVCEAAPSLCHLPWVSCVGFGFSDPCFSWILRSMEQFREKIAWKLVHHPVARILSGCWGGSAPHRSIPCPGAFLGSPLLFEFRRTKIARN
jgi:hypothetical protein